MNDERMSQLVLKFASERRCTLESFEAGPNAELVVESVGARAPTSSPRWLVGESGSENRTSCRLRVTPRYAAGGVLLSRLMGGGVGCSTA